MPHGRGWDPNDLFALHIARAVLTGSPPPATISTIATADALDILRYHKLLGLADPDWRACEPIRDRLRLLQPQQSMRAVQRVRRAAQVRDCLQAAEVPALFFKGIVLSQIVWGNPGARGIGDIDVLVSPEDVERAVTALRPIGIRPPAILADLRPNALARTLHHALCLNFDGVELDLHYRLDASPALLAVGFRELLDTARTVAIRGEEFTTLSEQMTLLTLAANGGRDLWARWGQVLDFAVLDARTEITDHLGARRRLQSGRAMAEWLSGGAGHPGLRTGTPTRALPRHPARQPRASRIRQRSAQRSGRQGLAVALRALGSRRPAYGAGTGLAGGRGGPGRAGRPGGTGAGRCSQGPAHVATGGHGATGSPVRPGGRCGGAHGSTRTRSGICRPR